MKKLYLSLIIALAFTQLSNAQWLNTNQLTDMNVWSSLPGFIGWYGTATNGPTSNIYGTGIQFVIPEDGRFGSQLVFPLWDNQIYYRQNSAGNWTNWFNIWSSANFDPDTYLDRSVTSIAGTGSVNAFSNGYTFAYVSSGTPWSGSLISYGGLGSSYDTQINSDYGPNGGNHISFRTMNGDHQVWNSWNEIYHSGNLNNSNVDFTAKTLNSTNIYNNGNLWSKQITVAIVNPWGDYVFDKDYDLAPLSKVQSYIDQNHHLPEMPSAAEIKEKGLNVGEMNLLLTKKVEELTLYLIEKDKQIKEQNQKQQTQTDQMKQLQDQLNNIQNQLKQIGTKTKS